MSMRKRSSEKPSKTFSGQGGTKRSGRTGAAGARFCPCGGEGARVMAEAAADVLGARMEKGLVVTKYGHAKGALPGFLVMEAGHPVPDENSVRAGEAAVRFVREAGEGDTVLFLISGGGSALLELPEEGLSLSDIQETTQKLLRCGADITEINLIRKRLSSVKGGKLAGCLRSGKAYSVHPVGCGGRERGYDRLRTHLSGQKRSAGSAAASGKI